MNIGKKPQAILLSDSDEEECQHYQPPTSKLIDVSIIVLVLVLCRAGVVKINGMFSLLCDNNCILQHLFTHFFAM